MKNIKTRDIILSITGIGFIVLLVFISGGGKASQAIINATYYSASGQTMRAVFAESTVSFDLPQTGLVTLPIAISASGARYANPDESLVFWDKGGEVTVTKNGQVIYLGATSGALSGGPQTFGGKTSSTDGINPLDLYGGSVGNGTTDFGNNTIR